MPHTVFLFLDCRSASASREASESRSRLRVGRDPKYECLLLRPRRGTRQSEVIRDVGDRTVVVMDTFVTIKVIGHDETPQEIQHRTTAVERAFGWFREIEARCTRFDPASE